MAYVECPVCGLWSHDGRHKKMARHATDPAVLAAAELMAEALQASERLRTEETDPMGTRGYQGYRAIEKIMARYRRLVVVMVKQALAAWKAVKIE